MSTSLKILIPLISENITAKDLTPEYGFIDAFTDDSNRPYLNNHIFLMYDWFTDTPEKWKRFHRMKKDKNIHHYCRIKINNHNYAIYTYCLYGKDVNMLKRNCMCLSNESKTKIINFWHKTDTEIIDTILEGKLFHKYTQSFVPEGEYKKGMER